MKHAILPFLLIMSCFGYSQTSSHAIKEETSHQANPEVKVVNSNEVRYEIAPTPEPTVTVHPSPVKEVKKDKKEVDLSYYSSEEYYLSLKKSLEDYLNGLSVQQKQELEASNDSRFIRSKNALVEVEQKLADFEK